MGNSWADLPPELLNMIASRVFETDHFSLVCKSWNDALTNPVPICLMNYCRRTKTWRFHCQDSSFFIRFPQLKDAEIRCSKYGWLLMSRSDNALFFFNPSSNQTCKLQPKIGRGYNTVFFTHPPTSPDFIVVGIQTPIRFQGVGICMLKYGQHEWETKEHPTETEFLLSHGPPVWHHGQIYFLDVKGNVAMFDIINRRSYNCQLVGQQDDKIKEHYLFKLNGEVFGVFVFGDKGKDVNVFRLSTMMKWEVVEDIGDNVVFLSHHSASSCTADHMKSMANRIYFPRSHGGDSAVFYSFSDAKFRSLNGVYSSDDHTIGLKFLGNAAWVTPAAAPLSATMSLWDSKGVDDFSIAE